MSNTGIKPRRGGHMKIELVIELTIVPEINPYRGEQTDASEVEWFEDHLLADELILHSNLIGCEVGTVRVVKGKGSVMDDVRAALRSVVEADGGCDRYYSEDDDIGFRACCDVISYKPHEEDCYVMQARRALETLGPVE